MRNIEIWIKLYFQKGLEKYRLEKTPNESHRLAYTSGLLQEKLLLIGEPSVLFCPLNGFLKSCIILVGKCEFSGNCSAQEKVDETPWVAIEGPTKF